MPHTNCWGSIQKIAEDFVSKGPEYLSDSETALLTDPEVRQVVDDLANCGGDITRLHSNGSHRQDGMAQKRCP